MAFDEEFSLRNYIIETFEKIFKDMFNETEINEILNILYKPKIKHTDVILLNEKFNENFKKMVKNLNIYNEHENATLEIFKILKKCGHIYRISFSIHANELNCRLLDGLLHFGYNKNNKTYINKCFMQDFMKVSNIPLKRIYVYDIAKIINENKIFKVFIDYNCTEMNDVINGYDGTDEIGSIHIRNYVYNNFIKNANQNIFELCVYRIVKYEFACTPDHPEFSDFIINKSNIIENLIMMESLKDV